MNEADVIKLIHDGLAAAGLDDIPIVEPGTPVTTLPAIALDLAEDELTAGNRSLRHGLDVVVMVPRNDQVPQSARLGEITAIVLRGLIPSSVSFAGPLTPGARGGPGTNQPPATTRTIPVTYPGDEDLC